MRLSVLNFLMWIIYILHILGNNIDCMSTVLQYEIKLFLYTKNVKLYQIKFLRDYTIHPRTHPSQTEKGIGRLSEWKLPNKNKIGEKKTWEFFSLNQVRHCTLDLRRSRLSVPILSGDPCSLRTSVDDGKWGRPVGAHGLGRPTGGLESEFS